MNIVQFRMANLVCKHITLGGKENPKTKQKEQADSTSIWALLILFGLATLATDCDM